MATRRACWPPEPARESDAQGPGVYAPRPFVRADRGFDQSWFGWWSGSIAPLPISAPCGRNWRVGSGDRRRKMLIATGTSSHAGHVDSEYNLSSLRLLLDLGALWDVRNHAGKTPLDVLKKKHRVALWRLRESSKPMSDSSWGAGALVADISETNHAANGWSGLNDARRRARLVGGWQRGAYAPRSGPHRLCRGRSMSTARNCANTVSLAAPRSSSR